jgi:hypothetical protein
MLGKWSTIELQPHHNYLPFLCLVFHRLNEQDLKKSSLLWSLISYMGFGRSTFNEPWFPDLQNG